MTHYDEKTCHAALELKQHRIWIDKLLPELSNLRSLVVHAYISHDKYRSTSQLKIPCEQVVLRKFEEMRLLANVKHLSLYKYDYNSYPDLDGPKVAVWEWSARDGVKTDVKSLSSTSPKQAKGDPIDTDEDEEEAISA